MISDLDKPTINSADTRPAEGTTMNISCIVDGQPTPTISWTMNGSPLKTSENSEIFLRNNTKQLTIMNLNRTDSGEYRCVAMNSRGNVSSDGIALSVQCKKTFFHPFSFFFLVNIVAFKSLDKLLNYLLDFLYF